LSPAARRRLPAIRRGTIKNFGKLPFHDGLEFFRQLQQRNRLIGDQLSDFVAVIEQQAVPVLRVGFTLAVIIFLLAGVIIWRRRHQFFDRDPNVENDVPAVRHNREEEILLVWSGLTLVLLGILYQVWSA
jgi:plasmid stabilization system protein ParE